MLQRPHPCRRRLDERLLLQAQTQPASSRPVLNLHYSPPAHIALCLHCIACEPVSGRCVCATPSPEHPEIQHTEQSTGKALQGASRITLNLPPRSTLTNLDVTLRDQLNRPRNRRIVYRHSASPPPPQDRQSAPTTTPLTTYLGPKSPRPQNTGESCPVEAVFPTALG